jgi:signal transduction histidine kinase
MIRKIKTKITFAIILVSSLFALLIGLVLIYKSRQIVEEEACARLLSANKTIGQQFENSFHKLENLTDFTETILRSKAQNLEIKTEKDIEKIKIEVAPTILELAKKTQPFSIWIVFNPLITGGKHTISYFDKSGKGDYVRENEFNVTEINTHDSTMNWWFNAVEKGKEWSGPYVWKNFGRKLITYSRAIKINGRLLAVCGSDMDYDILKTKLISQKTNDLGYFWLADSSLKLVYHPYQNGQNIRNISGVKYQFMADSARHSPSPHLIRYQYKNQPMITAYYKMFNGWVVANSLSEQKIFSSVQRMLYFSITISVILLIIAGIIAYIIGNTISDPIVALVNKFREGARGNLKVRAAIKTGDELETLGNQFNLLMTQLELTIKQIQKGHDEIQLAKEKAEEADKLKSAFLSIIFHETRTPLNAIIGFSELLIQPDLSAEERVKYQQIINQSCNSFLLLINNIIDLSHLVANQLKLSISYFSLSELLNELSFYYHIRLDELHNPNLHLEVKYHPQETIILLGDKLRLFQVLSNLTDNALKYTNKGFVEVGYRLVSPNIEFYVKDTGIGLSPENHQIIFDSFRQVDISNSRMYPGAGLGLAIVKHLTQLMKGTIRLESELNQGTTFYITIPSHYTR